MPWNVIVAVSVLLGSVVEVDAETIIHAGRLINGHDGKLHREMSLVISDGKIVSVGKGIGTEPIHHGFKFLVGFVNCKRIVTFLPKLLDTFDSLSENKYVLFTDFVPDLNVCPV